MQMTPRRLQYLLEIQQGIFDRDSHASRTMQGDLSMLAIDGLIEGTDNYDPSVTDKGELLVADLVAQSSSSGSKLSTLYDILDSVLLEVKRTISPELRERIETELATKPRAIK